MYRTDLSEIHGVNFSRPGEADLSVIDGVEQGQMV